MRKFIICYVLFCISFYTESQNQNLSNQLVFEGEPYLAINPTNSQNIVVAWMGFVFANSPRLSIKVASSFNGGQSWSPIITMPHIVPTYKSADPSLAFDVNGNLYLSYIDYRENPDSGGVYVFKSTDGGLSWGLPKMVIDMYADGDKKPIDRPFLVVNETGDKLYMTTKPAPWIAAPNRPYFMSSTDFGATWSPWRYVDTANYLVGNTISAPFAPPSCSGNLFSCVYPSYLFSQNVYPQFILATTADNGNHFEYNSVFVGSQAITNDSAKLSYKLIHNPVNINHLVFVFPYSFTSDIDIYFTESLDAGLNWSSPKRINDDPIANGKMQDLLWADFDNDGDLVVSWRDRRNAPGVGYNKASEYYAAYRNKDSLNFGENFKLSDSLVGFNTILIQSGNDFMGMEVDNDTISAVWGNTRDGSLDIWFSRIAVQNGQISQTSLIESISSQVNITPNPSNGVYCFEEKNNFVIDKIEIYSQNGTLIKKYEGEFITKELDISNEKQGIYLVNFFSNGLVTSNKIIKN